MPSTALIKSVDVVEALDPQNTGYVYSDVLTEMVYNGNSALAQRLITDILEFVSKRRAVDAWLNTEVHTLNVQIPYLLKRLGDTLSADSTVARNAFCTKEIHLGERIATKLSQKVSTWAA